VQASANAKPFWLTFWLTYLSRRGEEGGGGEIGFRHCVEEGGGGGHAALLGKRDVIRKKHAEFSYGLRNLTNKMSFLTEYWCFSDASSPIIHFLTIIHISLPILW